MKNDFRRVAEKTRLFAEMSTVMHLTLCAARVKVTMGDEVVRDNKFEPSELQAQFLALLESKNIRHEVISQDDNTLVFAVSRDKSEDAQKVLREFLSPRMAALVCTGTFESYNSLTSISNTLLAPFSRTRREVIAAVAKLNG